MAGCGGSLLPSDGRTRMGHPKSETWRRRRVQTRWKGLRAREWGRVCVRERESLFLCVRVKSDPVIREQTPWTQIAKTRRTPSSSAMAKLAAAGSQQSTKA